MRIPSFEREKRKPFVSKTCRETSLRDCTLLGGNFRQLACGGRMPFTGYAILQV